MKVEIGYNIHMFYLASRIFWFLFAPANLLGIFMLFGVGALFTRFRRTARYLLSAVMIVYVAFGYGPMSAIFLRPLEDRFTRPSEPIAAPTGIIVLGGALKTQIMNARGTVALSEALKSAGVSGLTYARWSSERSRNHDLAQRLWQLEAENASLRKLLVEVTGDTRLALGLVTDTETTRRAGTR